MTKLTPATEYATRAKATVDGLDEIIKEAQTEALEAGRAQATKPEDPHDGPAFPTTAHIQGQRSPVSIIRGGISKRQWLAGQALTAAQGDVEKALWMADEILAHD